MNQPICICPPGFHFTDNDDHFKGCSPESPPGQSYSETVTAVMYKLDHTDSKTDFNYATDLSNDYMVPNNVTEMECKKACMDDCMCRVVTFGLEDLLCRKKSLPLVDGYQRSKAESKTFVKIKGKLHSLLPRLPKEGSKRKGKVEQRLVIGISLIVCIRHLWQHQ